ncbi:exported hypothetical protein [Candidatus Sulfopaludibacter sp. SbA3]|nr:exported hypothetical protein [Candidatus Sulfopaludibacter sp. SbA3]
MQGLLLECAVRAALIAAATAAVMAALHVRSAAARHAAWLGVVVWMLVLPAWTSWLPKLTVRLLAAPASPAAIRAVPVSPLALPQAPDLPVPEAPAPHFVWNWWTCLPAAWLLGAGLLLARVAIGTIRAHALIRTARRCQGLWTSSSCVAPVTVGWLHPKVILPEDAHNWTEAQRAAVLAHEHEHARRRDPLVRLLALLNRAAFWFHPLAWWLERRLSTLAEEACDAAVLAQGHDPFEYSSYLLEIARTVERRGRRVDVLGMAMPGSSLSRRIRQILSAHPAPSTPRVRTLCAASVCLLVSGVFAAGALGRQKAHVPAVLPLVAVAQPAQTEPPAPTPEPAPAPAPQAQKWRMLVLYFDMAMDTAAQGRAISAAEKFVGAQMETTDKMAIMVFRGAAPVVVQDFTDDRDRLRRAIQQLSGGPSGTADADLQLAGLRDAVHMLGRVEGKKALLYFAASMQRTGANDAGLQEVINAAVRANVAFFPIDAQGLIAKPPVP